MSSVALPEGRTLSLATDVTTRLSCGVVVFAGITHGDAPALAIRLADTEAALLARYAGQEPAAIEQLREARALYRSFGMDPSRHRPSSEALLRRVLLGKGLYRLGAAIDACNLASLTFLLPIGLYDLDRVRGDVLLRVGAPQDAFDGIRKDRVNVGGRLALFDEAGPFGSPTSDSLRTSVDATTRSILAVVMATAGYPAAAMAAHLDLLADLFGRYCGARELMRQVLGPGGIS